MFAEIGRGDTYEEDYRYLSAIGHGSTEEAILHYSHPTVSVRSDRHTPILLTIRDALLPRAGACLGELVSRR